MRDQSKDMNELDITIAELHFILTEIGERQEQERFNDELLNGSYHPNEVCIND